MTPQSWHKWHTESIIACVRWRCVGGWAGVCESMPGVTESHVASQVARNASTARLRGQDEAVSAADAHLHHSPRRAGTLSSECAPSAARVLNGRASWRAPEREIGAASGVALAHLDPTSQRRRKKQVRSPLLQAEWSRVHRWACSAASGQRGAASHAAGIASEGVPARTGRVPGSGEATAPRWWGGGGVLRSATAFTTSSL